MKGCPQRKPNKVTNPSTQARHWFSHAMFDVVPYRTARPDLMIGVGLPDGFKTYHGLQRKVALLHAATPFSYLWVAEDGTVRLERSSG